MSDLDSIWEWMERRKKELLDERRAHKVDAEAKHKNKAGAAPSSGAFYRPVRFREQGEVCDE